MLGIWYNVYSYHSALDPKIWYNWDYPNPLKIPQNPQNTLNMNLWKLCDYITFVIVELHFWDLVHCFLISFCFGSEMWKKIGPKKPKNPQKRLMDFHDGISCQCFELEGWGLVQCLLLSFCFGFEFVFKFIFFSKFFLSRRNFISTRL